MKMISLRQGHGQGQEQGTRYFDKRDNKEKGDKIVEQSCTNANFASTAGLQI